MKRVKSLCLIASVLALAVPASDGATFNDHFADRTVLSGTSATSGGSNQSATAEPNEPEHSALPDAQTGSRRTLWWSWTATTANTVIISVTRTNGSFPSPMLAVWTGSSLGSLSSVASNFSGVARCRVVFTPVAGTAYQIAVDDNGDVSSDNGIRFQLTVQVVPPPAHDDFTYRSVIPGTQIDTAATFVGASRQGGEPAHGASNFPQTLWWTWTAPPGALSHRATLHADSVSYPPDVGVYTGNGFPLTAVSGVSNAAFGMTRVAHFLAVPGTTYHFAVAGRQTDPAPNGAATNYGAVRLRFNASTLALVITNRTGATNEDFQSPFFETVMLTNGLRIENWGNSTSRPVRIRLEAHPGLGLRADAPAPAYPSPSNLFTSASITVPHLQSISLLVTGRCPAPYNPGFDFDRGIGWGVYALLEEQVGSAWFVVDHQLAGFGPWPEVGGFPGPGGGVIRIDPQVAAGTLCVPVLQQIQITAPAMVTEGTTINLSATAMFNCPSNITFTSTVWSNSHPGSTITTNGVFRAGSVTNDTPITVNCFFEYRGVLSNASRQLMINNLPSPFIATRTRLGNGTFQLGGSGVPDRRHAIQASTNLCCASNWVTLLPTNVIATGGAWSFIDTNASVHPRRFYRVRELD